MPTNYAREVLSKTMLGELIDLISTIGMGEESDKSKDILGRVYEYFLGGFAYGTAKLLMKIEKVGCAGICNE